MKDFPLRAWVLNGSQEYKIKQTKVHGDVRAVNVTLQGENKVHLLFTVLSTDQRSTYDLFLIEKKKHHQRYIASETYFGFTVGR